MGSLCSFQPQHTEVSDSSPLNSLNIKSDSLVQKIRDNVDILIISEIKSDKGFPDG